MLEDVFIGCSAKMPCMSSLALKNLNSPWKRLEASDPSQLYSSTNLNLELSLNSTNKITFSRMFRKQRSLFNSLEIRFHGF